MKLRLVLFTLLFIIFGPQAWAQTAEAARGPWNVYLGTSKLAPDHATEAACVEAARLLPSPPASAVQAYGCRTITRVTVTQPPAAPPAPVETWTRIAGEGEAFTVPAGSTVRYGAGTSFLTRVVSGAGQCTNTFFGGDPAREIVKACELSNNAPPVDNPPPAPPPASSPSPTPAGTVYFSPSGANSNPGTRALPKRDVAGLDINAMPGAILLFERGGTYPWPQVIFEGSGTLAAPALTIDAYGAGAAPVLNAPTSGMLFGRWSGESMTGGYILRNFTLHGNAADQSNGMFFLSNVNGVRIENVTIENFNFGLQASAGPAGAAGVRNIAVLNSNIVRNTSIGVLGMFNDMLFEGNLIEGNNTTGSGFEHGTYLSGNGTTGGRNVTLRNNRYLRNSVVNGVCQGGNMTFHGLMNGVLIEGNRIEQDSSAPGCWLLSITQGYATAEGFRNTVVRNNRLINGGNNAMNAQSAPGILIEGNVIINTQPASQIAISVGHTDYPNGDLPDGNATVRNNTVCQSGGASGAAVVFRNNPGAVESGNVVITGAAATTGVCAR